MSKRFDKYYYYQKSVQSPEVDAAFFDKTYKDIRGKSAQTLREDFCGTFLISTEWVKLGESKKSIGVDLDEEPIKYGKKNYLPLLTQEQIKRVKIVKGDVLNPKNPKADIVSASNFSYYCFKDREILKKYFKSALKSLKKEGIFIVDAFGGTGTTEPVEEETEHDGFSYFWDQDSFDPVNNHAIFYIHFKRKGEKKREKIFTYDWRMWSIPEIRDLMKEVGFKDVKVYWEGTDKDGSGDGNFKPVVEGEYCESWITYIVGLN